MGGEKKKLKDRLTGARARKIECFLSQPFFVVEVFTGSPGLSNSEELVSIYAELLHI